MRCELTALFYLFLRGWQGSLDTRVAYWGASVVMALAALTLGLIGVLFPLGVVFFFILFTRSWGRWRELRIFSSTLIFLVIAVPWHWMAEERSPGFLWSYFINEHFKRALGTRYPPDYEAVPLLLWWALHLVWFFPWSFFIGYALREFPRPKTWGPKMEHVQEARLLLFIWAGLILFFFSLTSGSRMEYYSFGAWPAMAVLLGIGLNDAEEVRDRWLPRLQAGLAVIGVLASVCLGYLVLSSLDVSSKGGISHLHTVSPARYLPAVDGAYFRPDAADFRGAARSGSFRHPDLYYWFWQSVAVAAALEEFRRHPHPGFRHGAVFLCRQLGFQDGSSRACHRARWPTPSFPTSGLRTRSCSTATSIRARAFPSTLIATCGFTTDASAPTLKSVRTIPTFRPRFWTTSSSPLSGTGPERVFIFVPEEFRKDALSRLPPDSSYLLAESAGKYIFVNQPLRPDLPLLASVLKRHPVE